MYKPHLYEKDHVVPCLPLKAFPYTITFHQKSPFTKKVNTLLNKHKSLNKTWNSLHNRLTITKTGYLQNKYPTVRGLVEPGSHSLRCS